ncbi:uncharacterized protein LOC143876619 [Tasmannia lanceolata]|uniref:uncharacterized protein LOC143876619 n=1 Tax=Tasmannia lanceolata TaxID=3420 RepID=UPI0040639095
MAELPPNLDDLELWLPSDIFPDEIYDPQTSSILTPEFPSQLTYMENLAKQLQAFSIKPPPNLIPNFLEIGPGSRFATVSPPPQAGLGFRVSYPGAGQNPTGFVNGGFRSGSGPGNQYYPVKPVQPQVESFLQERARVLQRQQNRGQNRFLPVQVNGSRRTGFLRESGGTGVFLPRVSNVDFRKKSAMKSAEQKQPMRNVAGGRQGMTFQHPSEVGLPHEWTY